MNSDILAGLRRELKASADEATRISARRFFKEAIKLYGVKVPEVRKIAASHWRDVMSLGQATIWALCEELWRSGYIEEGTIAAEWAYALRKDYVAGDLARFEKWLKLYVTNWAECDTL